MNKLIEGVVLGYNVTGCLVKFSTMKLSVKLLNHPGKEKQGNKLEKKAKSAQTYQDVLRSPNC